MASNIDNTSIDATYPIAGQDNDSQGFRNNFSTIKNNFTAAKSEIEALQTNTAKLNETNDFLGNDITGGTQIFYGWELTGFCSFTNFFGHHLKSFKAFTISR